MLNVERTKLLDLLNINKEIVHAEGANLKASTGECYTDFTSQYGALPFGHNPDFLRQELADQLNSCPGVMVQPMHSLGAKDLAEKLLDILPSNLKHVTFANTGAEVVEAAIKLARSKTGRRTILSTQNSFHGKTMGAAMTTGNKYYQQDFYFEDKHFCHVPYDDLDALEESLKSKTIAAFFVEPIQGEGGMVEPSQGYLAACQNLCQQYGTLFVVDEIQTGLGRTGDLFVSLAEHLQPDIILIGKALGGGMLPISACVASNKAWSSDFGQRHSSTFANNHFAARMGLRTIEKLVTNPTILSNVTNLGAYLTSKLQTLVNDFPSVFTGRSGRGFMQGITLAPWLDREAYLPGFIYESGYAVAFVSSYLLNVHGILTAPTLNSHGVLRIQPNLLVTINQIDCFIDALQDVAQKLKARDYTSMLRVAMGLPVFSNRKNKNLPLPFPGIRPVKGQKRGTFAFFIHPTSAENAIASFSGQMNQFTENEIQRTLEWYENAKKISHEAVATYHIPMIESKDGGYVEGWLISSMLTPREMMRLSKKEKQSLLNSYIESAQEKGAEVIGLGAFTSVISRSGTDIQDCGLSVTTGNAYTALTSTDAVRKIAKRSGRKLRSLRLAVVGASGSVGRLALLDMASQCSSVCLIGNARNQHNVSSLERVAGELIAQLYDEKQIYEELRSGNKNCNLSSDLYAYEINSPIMQELTRAGISFKTVKRYLNSEMNESDDRFKLLYQGIREEYLNTIGSLDTFPITLTNSVAEYLSGCDIVITATSNGEAFIPVELFAKNAIICDAARPSDLLHQVNDKRHDVTVFEGGLVKLPEYITIGRSNMVGLDTGVGLACFSETIILAMEQVSGNFSLGGNSSLYEARQIFAWAEKHGFSTHIPTFLVDDENNDNAKLPDDIVSQEEYIEKVH